MAESTKQILLDIKVNYEEAVKRIAKLKIENEDLKKTQQELREEVKKGGDGQEEAARQLAVVEAQYKYNQKAIQVLNKEVEANLKIDKQKEDSLNQLKTALSFATAKYNEMSEAERKSAKGIEMQRSIDEITAKLKEEEAALGNHRRSIGDYETSTRNLRAELKEYTRQLQEMTLEGKRGTAEFAEMQKKAAELKTAIDSANLSVKNTASATNVFNGLSQSLQTLVGSFGLYQSALGLTDTENKNLTATMKNLQITMAAIASLTAIQKALLKESAMMTLAHNVATKAGAAAQWILGTSVTATSVAFKLLRGAIIATGIGALIVLIGTLVSHWEDLTKWLKSSTDGMSGFGKALDKVKEVAMGVWEVIKTYILAPFKMLGKILQGDFTGVIDEVKKGFDVVGNYQKGANEQMIKNQEAAAQRKIQAERKVQSEALLSEAGKLEKSLAVNKAMGDSAESLYKQEMEILDKKIKGYRLALQNISDINSDAYKDMQKKLDDLDQDRKVKEATETKRLQDVAKQRAKDALQAEKEQSDKQREAIRQAQDTALALVKDGVDKQRQTINQSYDRQIEDLRRKLATEKNLTTAARKALNGTIKNLEEKQEQDIAKLKEQYSQDALNKQIDKEQKRIELQLAAVKAESDEEYNLKLQSIANRRDAELTANAQLAEELRQDEAEINAKYDKMRLDEIDKQNTEIGRRQALALENGFNEQLQKIGDNETAKAKLQLDYQQQLHDQLVNMDADLKEKLYKSEEDYTAAVLASKQKIIDAEKAVKQASAQTLQNQLSATSEFAGTMSDLMTTIAGDNEEYAGFLKAMAIFQIALNTALAISSAIESASKGDPYTVAIRIAAAVVAAIAGMAKATSALNSAKQPKAPKFATGGLVSGEGSGTSDSITARLSNGESVMTAQTTSMFAPILSSLNQIGGGIPIGIAEKSQQIMGEDMMSRAFAKAIAGLPNPVLDYKEFTDFTKRVQILENLSTK